jgi:capsular polysaccharide biosynthesis protein
MENGTKIKYFLAVTVVVSVICFAIFINGNPVYRGETEVLLIARNSVVDEKIEPLTESVKNIPLTLSFYDRLIKSGEVDDPVKNMPAQKRKAYWLTQIKTERLDSSSIIKITAFSGNYDQAGKLAGLYAQELSRSVAQYYNVRKQLDIRVIDQPTASFDFGKSVWPQAAKSILWGIVAGILDVVVITFIPKTYKKKKGVSFYKNFFTYKNGASEKIPEEEPDYFPTIFSKKPEEKKPARDTGGESKIITPEKKSTAPENLPFADDEAAQIFEQKMYSNGKDKARKLPTRGEEKIKEREEPAIQKPPEEDIFREATPEEVKERLNKLLSGKM